MKKTLKKLTCALLATVSALGCAATMSACETSHPKVKMQIEFNGTTYTLDYKLYRRTAPATVEHFLYLAGNGYYDGLCVHDYVEADRLYTGEYTTASVGELTRKNYYETIASYANYAQFPHSVWENDDKTAPTYTLKGEFSDNNFSVESDFIGESFGSLSMYYYNDAKADFNVYNVRASEEGAVNKSKYKYNLTTSAFFISLKTTKTTNTSYCTFAEVEEDSRETLEALEQAINDYVSANYEDKADFTQSVSKQVFEHDPFLKEYKTQVRFNVPKENIIIKKVEVKKY